MLQACMISKWYSGCSKWFCKSHNVCNCSLAKTVVDLTGDPSLSSADGSAVASSTWVSTPLYNLHVDKKRKIVSSFQILRGEYVHIIFLVGCHWSGADTEYLEGRLLCYCCARNFWSYAHFRVKQRPFRSFWRETHQSQQLNRSVFERSFFWSGLRWAKTAFFLVL
jgi:hypothetical protein